MMYGNKGGEYGRKAHEKLRKMVHHPESLGQGQDDLRAEIFDVTAESNQSLGHDIVPSSHVRARGSVAPSRKKR